MAPLSGCGFPVKGDREFFFLFFRHCSSFLSSLKETKQRKVRNVFEENTTHRAVIGSAASLVEECFREFYSKSYRDEKNEAQPTSKTFRTKRHL
jgi:hypothetical protein